MRKSFWVFVGGLAALMGAVSSLSNRAVNEMTRAKRHDDEACLKAQQELGLLDKEDYRRLQKQQVEIKSSDGLRLHAVLLEGDTSQNRVMILVHGYTASSAWMLHLSIPFIRRGWTVLLVDQRSHGQSEGTYATYGRYEKDDLDHWVRWVIDRYGNSVTVGMLGQSMGGSTVLEYAAINEHVKFIIADCPYSDVRELMRHLMSRPINWPMRPLWLLVDRKLQRRAGFRMQDVSPINAIRNCSIPVMFVHGSEDNFVPTWMSKAMFAAKQGIKKLLIVEGAAHGRAYPTDKDLYEREMFSFIEEALAKTEQLKEA